MVAGGYLPWPFSACYGLCYRDLRTFCRAAGCRTIRAFLYIHTPTYPHALLFHRATRRTRGACVAFADGRGSCKQTAPLLLSMPMTCRSPTYGWLLTNIAGRCLDLLADVALSSLRHLLPSTALRAIVLGGLKCIAPGRTVWTVADDAFCALLFAVLSKDAAWVRAVPRLLRYLQRFLPCCYYLPFRGHYYLPPARYRCTCCHLPALFLPAYGTTTTLPATARCGRALRAACLPHHCYRTLHFAHLPSLRACCNAYALTGLGRGCGW